MHRNIHIFYLISIETSSFCSDALQRFARGPVNWLSCMSSNCNLVICDRDTGSDPDRLCVECEYNKNRNRNVNDRGRSNDEDALVIGWIKSK